MIKRTLLRIIANMGALYGVGLMLSGSFLVTGGWRGYLIAAIIFGFLNGFVKPILKILSLPIVLLTAGVFILVINTFLVWFAKYSLDILRFEGVRVVIEGGVGTYISVALLLSVVNMVLHWLLTE